MSAVGYACTNCALYIRHKEQEPLLGCSNNDQKKLSQGMIKGAGGQAGATFLTLWLGFEMERDGVFQGVFLFPFLLCFCTGLSLPVLSGC